MAGRTAILLGKRWIRLIQLAAIIMVSLVTAFTIGAGNVAAGGDPNQKPFPNDLGTHRR